MHQEEILGVPETDRNLRPEKEDIVCPKVVVVVVVGGVVAAAVAVAEAMVVVVTTTTTTKNFKHD
jgi:hypothetical protein